MLKALVSHLLLRDREVILLDMAAGLEHWAAVPRSPSIRCL